MTCGIYKITNLITNKVCVGQSKDIKKRYREHWFSALHIGDKDHSSSIHLSMAKYKNKENFLLEILEECSQDKLNEREIYWINYYNSYLKGYNATTGGDNHEYAGKIVECYDFNGNFIKSYPSVTKFAEENGCSRNQAYQVLHGHRKSCKGYQLKYKDNDKKIEKYNSQQGGTTAVGQYDKATGELIKIYKSIAEAARETGADASTISKVCRNKLKSTKGYAWRYVDEIR